LVGGGLDAIDEGQELVGHAAAGAAAARGVAPGAFGQQGVHLVDE
jgi:hypothetical protein